MKKLVTIAAKRSKATGEADHPALPAGKSGSRASFPK
jgi:hypothetical protein